jgi:hypothetical protein
VLKEDPEAGLWPNDRGIHGWGWRGSEALQGKKDPSHPRMRSLVPVTSDGLCTPDIAPHSNTNQLPYRLGTDRPEILLSKKGPRVR